MSGLTLSEIRDALKARIDSVSDEINVEAYPTAEDPPPPPSFVIQAASNYIDYFVTFGSSGLATVRFAVVFTPGNEGGDYESRWKDLDTFLSVGTGNASSIIDAIMTNGATLGLTGCVARITDLFVDSVAVAATLTVEVTINKVGAEV